MRSDVRLSNLLEEPLETFSHANVRKVSFQDCTGWSYATAITSITASSAFSDLREMELVGTNFWRLSEVTRQRLVSGFTTVTTLSLQDVRFQGPEYYITFMSSFPSLKYVSMNRCRCDALSASAALYGPTSIQLRIRTLRLEQCETPEMWGVFVPSPALVKFSITVNGSTHGRCHDEEVLVINAILRSAASSLEELEMMGTSTFPSSTHRTFLVVTTTYRG
ncbi:hypothetical protein VNI00_004418 [Paramarasmius palmivorus]|uniref:Uncharacterized protein n=1 Tax=Paramarasmius palmivorus TaxID=297713 RepID=A0AAW0DKC7_9AGAR